MILYLNNEGVSVVCPRFGATKICLLITLLGILKISQHFMLISAHHFLICQVSPLFSCDNACQILAWYTTCTESLHETEQRAKYDEWFFLLMPTPGLLEKVGIPIFRWIVQTNVPHDNLLPFAVDAQFVLLYSWFEYIHLTPGRSISGINPATLILSIKLGAVPILHRLWINSANSAYRLNFIFTRIVYEWVMSHQIFFKQLV